MFDELEFKQSSFNVSKNLEVRLYCSHTYKTLIHSLVREEAYPSLCSHFDSKNGS